jgi:hypothetical protein
MKFNWGWVNWRSICPLHCQCFVNAIMTGMMSRLSICIISNLSQGENLNLLQNQICIWQVGLCILFFVVRFLTFVLYSAIFLVLFHWWPVMHLVQWYHFSPFTMHSSFSLGFGSWGGFLAAHCFYSLFSIGWVEVNSCILSLLWRAVVSQI